MSAIKGSTPANRANVKYTKINEIAEITEFGVTDSAPWHKEFPRSKGDYNKIVVDPVSKDYSDKSLRDYAIARFAAIQLANGKGLINDNDDKSEWEGSDIQKNDNRRNPIIWLDKSAFLLKLPMSSPSMDGVPAELMKVSKWRDSLGERHSTTRRSPLAILRTLANVLSLVGIIPYS